MQARIDNPVVTIPSAMEAMLGLGKAVQRTGVSRQLSDLISLRASQINGCSFCVDMHARDLRKAGESDERLFGLAAWRDTPFFTDAERAALALTEAATRLSDSADPVPDEVWDEAARHYDESTLAGVVLAIALINTWNRINVTTEQPPDAAAAEQARELEGVGTT
jgi:AhpD family alkylhydroperoxidase